MRKRLQYLRQWRFWVNYAVILLVTSWLPLFKQTATMTKADGTVLKQMTMSVPAYRSWYVLFTKGPSTGQLQPVLMHLGLCFIIIALVWLVMFRPIIQDLPDPAIDLPEEEKPPSSGDAPHE